MKTLNVRFIISEKVRNNLISCISRVSAHVESSSHFLLKRVRDNQSIAQKENESQCKENSKIKFCINYRREKICWNKKNLLFDSTYTRSSILSIKYWLGRYYVFNLYRFVIFSAIRSKKKHAQVSNSCR